MIPSHSSPNEDAGSLHVILVSNLPLGSIQTSASVKSTERLSSNVTVLRLTPGTTTSFSADGVHSDIAFQFQGNIRNTLQLPEFLIWYPLPAIGGGAPQLLNNSPSGRDLLVFATKRLVDRPGNASRSRRGDDDGDGGGNRNIASLVPIGQSIAVESAAAATTTATACVEIVVPIHSAEEGRRRWRLGYYVVTPIYPRETIAKLLGGGDGGDGRLSPLWFSSRDLYPSEEQLLSGGRQEEEGTEEEDVEMEEADDEKSSRPSGDSSNSSPTVTRKSTKEMRARTRRRRRDSQRSTSDSDELNYITSRRRDHGRAGRAGGVKSRATRNVATIEDEEEESEFEGPFDDEEPYRVEREGNDIDTAQFGPGPGLMSLPWAALTGGIRLRGQVDIAPLNRPRHV